MEKDIKQMNFEEAVNALEEIVNKLENGLISLDDAIKNYTNGTKLKEHCEKKLSEAKLKLEKISL